MLAAAQVAVHAQASLERRGLEQLVILRLEHAAVVAGENHERVLGDAELVERVEHAADAAVEFLNPIAVETRLALAREILVGRDGVVDGDRRKVEEKRFVPGLLRDPRRRLVGEHLHHALVLPARRGEIENASGSFATFGVLGTVGRFEIIRVRHRPGDFHVRGNLSIAESVNETVLDENACEIAVIARHAEMIFETNVERPGGEFGGVIGPPLRRVVGGAVAEMPFAHGSGCVAVLLEHRRHVQAVRLDVQRRERAQHFVLQ